MLNLILGIGIVYSYLQLPARNYYSTDGITPPARLTPLAQPNYSSTPLLADDQEAESNQKAIPQ
jgi:intracellular multiplication protein IcmM